MSIYDQLPKGAFAKFTTIGDKVVGDVTGVAIGEDFNGKPCPQLTIVEDDGNEVIVTAGQANLKAQIIEKRVEVGDRISIRLDSEVPRTKGSLKVFEVKVTKGGAKGTVAANTTEEEPF